MVNLAKEIDGSRLIKLKDKNGRKLSNTAALRLLSRAGFKGVDFATMDDVYLAIERLFIKSEKNKNKKIEVYPPFDSEEEEEPPKKKHHKK